MRAARLTQIAPYPVKQALIVKHVLALPDLSHSIFLRHLVKTDYATLVPRLVRLTDCRVLVEEVSCHLFDIVIYEVFMHDYFIRSPL